jgi:uncharacterized surface protein with fasciclin (FAS1) repeats
MKRNKRFAAVALAAALVASPASMASSQASDLKMLPLTEVLNLDNPKFDKSWGDFDVFTSVFLDVWIAKPKSAVSAISDGTVKLTAFVPTDKAFQRLVKALTGKKLKSEKAVADAVMSLGANTVEKVILYHVVLGDPILSPAALQANGAQLATAGGETLGVQVNGTTINLIDKSDATKNALVILSKVDINKGTTQVAHGINQVLLPTL